MIKHATVFYNFLLNVWEVIIFDSTDTIFNFLFFLYKRTPAKTQPNRKTVAVTTPEGPFNLFVLDNSLSFDRCWLQRTVPEHVFVLARGAFISNNQLTLVQGIRVAIGQCYPIFVESPLPHCTPLEKDSLLPSRFNIEFLIFSIDYKKAKRHIVIICLT